MNSLDSFLDNCYISNIEEIFEFCKTKLNNYITTRTLNIKLEELLDKNILHFLIEQSGNVIEIIGEKTDSKFILSTTNLTKTPDEFKDVIINNEMFIIGLIHCYRTISFIYNYEENKQIDNKRIIEIYEMLNLILMNTSYKVEDILNKNMGFATCKNGKIKIGKIIIKESEHKDLCIFAEIINEVKYLQSLKFTIKFLQQEYNYFFNI